MGRIKKPVFVGLLLLGITLLCALFVSLINIYDNDNKGAGTQDTKDSLTVVTSFYPMYIAVWNVIGDAKGVTIKNLSGPETGCLHDYQLTPEDMKLLKSADVFIINGGGIESFIGDVIKEYPDLFIIEACDGIELSDEDGAEDHGGGEDGNEDEKNAHVWMSVSLYEKQIENIENGLLKADTDGERRALYRDNAKEYKEKLFELKELSEKIKESSGKKDVIIFHEAFSYLCGDTGLRAVYTMDLDEERQISAKEVFGVIDAIKENNASMILAEEEYGKEMAEMVKKETGVTVLYLDPLTRANGAYDPEGYIKKMRENLLKIREAL